MSLRIQLSMYFNIIGRISDPEVRIMQKSGLLPKEKGLAYLTDKMKGIISITQCLQACIYFMQLALYTYTYSVNSPVVSTEAVGFVGGTAFESVGVTVPKETTSVVFVI